MKSVRSALVVVAILALLTAWTLPVAANAPLTRGQAPPDQPPITDGGRLSLTQFAKAGQPNQHQVPRTVYAETDPNGTAPAIYIVQLVGPPLATYGGGVAGLDPTSPQATGARKLDARSVASSSYRAYLGQRQADFRRAAESAVGRPLDVLYTYATVFNGLAVQLTPQEAAKLLGLEGVRSIQRSQWRQATTDTSPNILWA